MALDAWMGEVRETELDSESFITTLKNRWAGILADFDEGKSSAPAEGINPKIRVMLRRGYGIRNLATLWSGVLLDGLWAAKKIGRNIADLRQLVGRIQRHFARNCT